MNAKLLALSLALFGAPVAAEEHPQLAAGLEAYDFFCSKCHGKDMVNSGVSSFDLRKFPRDQKERFYTSVLKGKGDMPAWGDVIYPEEMDALWVYVATRGGTEPMPEEEGAALDDPSQDLLHAGQLTACLARSAGALSGRRADGGAGMDYRVAKAVADGLNLDLRVEWYEAEAGEESDPVLETYAMLAHPLCDMVLSHPLYQPAVGNPPAETGALPRWLGMPTEIDAETQRRVDKHMPHVTLKPIAVSEPYMRAEIGLVYRNGVPEPANLREIGPYRLAVQQGTLSGSIATASGLSNVTTFNPGHGFLWHLERGEADVAIVDVAAFDGHRRHNIITELQLAEWRHPLGFDIGVAVLADHAGLKAAIDSTIIALSASGALETFAAEEGLTYAAPHGAGVLPPLSLQSLLVAAN